MIEGILFDIDGVILDSEQLHAETESETAKSFGIIISPEEVVRLYSGIKIEKEFEDMKNRFRKDFPLDKALNIRMGILKQRIQEGVPTIPHASEVLHSLSGNFSLGFATSAEKYFVEPALKCVHLLDLFQTRVYGEDVKHHKPDPEPYLKAANLLNIKPEESVVIEDSSSGFKSAKAADMLLIARRADHNRHLDFSLADYIVEDLREIPQIIESINHAK